LTGPVLDPAEGVAPDGTIVTGAARAHVPAAFEPVLAAAVALVRDGWPGAVLHVYGSVATGRARVGGSDVDLLSVDVPAEAAAAIGAALSRRFADLCRGVEIGAGRSSDAVGDADEAYGNRVFLRHYCVRLTGPAPTGLAVAYPADARAARGFNGDIAVHARRWRRELDAGADPVPLARRVARKSLFAAAGLVSVHDRTWTTDRATAAARWARIAPATAAGTAALARWAEVSADVTRADLREVLDDGVAPLVAAFAARVGLWA